MVRLHIRSLPAVTLLCSVFYLSACGDQPTGPPPKTAPATPAAAFRPHRVATIGVLLRREGSAFVLKQQELGFKPGPSWRARVLKHDLPIGKAGNDLRVMTDATTPVYMGGSRSALDAVPLGTALLVAGERSGERLRADLVTDLQGEATPRRAQSLVVDQVSEQPMTAVALERSEASTSVTSLCLGQDMDYTAEDIHEFHGCWGGPSASDNIDVPNILGLSGVPFACPVVGCFVVDEYSYTFALGGWAYDFPFRFGATGPGLTYHVPGNVSLSLAALPASGTAFTFTGGLGFDYGLNVDFCPVIGDCAEVGTIHLSLLSMIHQTTGAGPLQPSQRLDIAEVSCPSVGVLVIPNFPLDPLALGLCEDLGLTGRSFFAKVTAEGASQLAAPIVGFDGSNQTLNVRPDALQVTISYSEFSWAPEMTMGFFFRLKSFGITLIDSPTIPLTAGAFEPVSTPFPKPGFTVATDPLSPVGDLRYLFQPTVATVAVLSVAPAPSTLAIVSAPALAEGEPVRARLTESYDGSPIAGVRVAFTATTGTGSSTVFGTTDGSGEAQALFPNGEYALQAQFAGTPFYVAAAASQPRVFVYRPTTFVIWGGNAEGIAAGRRYQFWGAEWYTQVTGGDYTADESFKGFAHTTTALYWTAGGGNSTPPPAELAEYIGVIVATSAAKERQSIVGNIAARVILRVEDLASYGTEPGHQAFGTLQAQGAN